MRFLAGSTLLTDLATEQELAMKRIVNILAKVRVPGFIAMLQITIRSTD